MWARRWRRTEIVKHLLDTYIRDNKKEIVMSYLLREVIRAKQK